jgi:hypothetical protein
METGPNLALVAARTDVLFIATSLLVRRSMSEPLLLALSASAANWRQQEKDSGAPEQYLQAFDAVLSDLLRDAQRPPSPESPPA